ncbi:MAG: hypothetical protein IT305_01165 [Chloroflexi bacterium]|nr:hypothetical protein [Chloroflexota bacterium]
MILPPRIARVAAAFGLALALLATAVTTSALAAEQHESIYKTKKDDQGQGGKEHGSKHEDDGEMEALLQGILETAVDLAPSAVPSLIQLFR